MAKEYENRKSTQTIRECVKFVCDICGTPARFPTSTDDAWGNSRYEVAETSVKCKTGSAYPEGGSTTTTSFDVCVKCFEEKLAPFLESLGAKPTVEEVDF